MPPEPSCGLISFLSLRRLTYPAGVLSGLVGGSPFVFLVISIEVMGELYGLAFVVVGRLLVTQTVPIGA